MADYIEIATIRFFSFKTITLQYLNQNGMIAKDYFESKLIC